MISGLTVLGDGRVIAGGFSHGQALDGSGESRGQIVVLGASGEELRREELDHPGLDSVDAISSSGDQVVFAGRIEGPAPGQTPGGFSDLLVGRLEEGGLSLFRWGNERPQRPRRIALRQGGQSVVIAGLDDVYVPTNYVESWENPLALEVSLQAADAPAEVRWVYAPKTPVSDLLEAAAVQGEQFSFVAGVVQAGPERGLHVMRFNEAGEQGWRSQLTQVSFDGWAGMAWAPDGSLVVAGSTMGSLGGQADGSQDVFVAWLDPSDGAIRRVRRLEESGAQWATGLVVGSDGTVFVAGETDGSLGKVPAPAEGMDAFLVAFPPSDEPLRVWQGGTDSDDLVTGLALDGCGRLYVAGSSLGAFPGQAAPGRFQGFLLQVEPDLLAVP